MGKRISGRETMFGVSAIVLRNAMRTVRGQSFTVPELSRALKMDDGKAQRLVNDLLDARLVERDEEDEHNARHFRLTEEGDSLSLARATRPLKRVKAEELLAGAVVAAKGINEDSNAPFYVEQLYVFGSYLSDKAEIGDLDLCVKLEWRVGNMSRKEWMDWCQDFPGASGDVLQRLRFVEQVLLRRLKQRSPYVSIHGVDELNQMGVERRLVFEEDVVAVPSRSSQHTALLERFRCVIENRNTGSMDLEKFNEMARGLNKEELDYLQEILARL